MFLISIWVFIAGACVGSFLNVVIYRLQSNRHSFLTKRSYCYHCHQTLWVRDLIPILSWLWLGGRCRFCHSRISFRYLLVELSIGLLALICWLYAQTPLQAGDIFLFCTILIAIGLIDLDTWTIPLQLPAIIGISGLLTGYFEGSEVFYARLIGLLVGLAFFSLFLLVSSWVLRQTGRLKAGEYAMGWGDPILIGVIGANLGWLMLAPMILLASLQGIALYGFSSWSRNTLPDDDWVPPRHSMPFGPFLTLAALEISLWNLI